MSHLSSSAIGEEQPDSVAACRYAWCNEAGRPFQVDELARKVERWNWMALSRDIVRSRLIETA